MTADIVVYGRLAGRPQQLPEGRGWPASGGEPNWAEHADFDGGVRCSPLKGFFRSPGNG